MSQTTPYRPLLPLKLYEPIRGIRYRARSAKANEHHAVLLFGPDTQLLLGIVVGDAVEIAYDAGAGCLRFRKAPTGDSGYVLSRPGEGSRALAIILTTRNRDLPRATTPGVHLVDIHEADGWVYGTFPQEQEEGGV